MSRKRYTPEQIIGMLRQAEVLLSQGRKTGEVCHRLGISEQSSGTSCSMAIFYTLKEAKVLIEQWRWHYNTIRPHSALGCRPPSPAAILPDTNMQVYAVPQPTHGSGQPRQTLS